MEEKITKQMTLGDLVMKYPKAAKKLAKYGLHCVGCHVASFETIDQGAKAHGMKDAEIEKMIEDLNQTINQKQLEAKNES